MPRGLKLETIVGTNEVGTRDVARLIEAGAKSRRRGLELVSKDFVSPENKTLFKGG